MRGLILAALAHKEGLEPRRYREAVEARVAELASELADARDTIEEYEQKWNTLAAQLAEARARLAEVESLRDVVRKLQEPDPDTGDRQVSFLALCDALEVDTVTE